MEKCSILVWIGGRSDEGLSAPVLEKLEKDPFFTCYVQTLYEGNFHKSFKFASHILDIDPPVDIVLCVGDRIEMYAAALASYLKRIPVAHLYAGTTVKGFPTQDEIFRHCITLCSEIQFCESGLTENNVFYLFKAIGKKLNAHVVGCTHLENLTIDESLVPKEPYNLILYNPLTAPDKVELMFYDIERIKAVSNLGFDYNIIIGTNKDAWNYNIPFFDALVKHMTIFIENLERPKFLGLLKNCSKFISNSSATIYEAPKFLNPKQIINIGIRNEQRTPPNLSIKNASDTIIQKLKEWWTEKIFILNAKKHMGIDI